MEEFVMKINKNKEGSTLTVSLEGRLDTTTSPELFKELDTALEGVKKLVFDLTSLEYISSSGLRVLLSAQKTMNTAGEMIVCGVSQDILEIFDVTGFSDFLTIE